jgi:hypothetical protein
VLRYVKSGKLKGTKLGRDYTFAENTVTALPERSEPATQTANGALVTARPSAGVRVGTRPRTPRRRCARPACWCDRS